MSFLKGLKVGIKDVFGWLGSAKGQAVIAAGEGIAETISPSLTGIINLGNVWLTKAITIEAVAEAAGANNGTGVQKAAAVLTDVTPLALQYAKDAGLPAPTATQIALANDAIVAFLKALSTPAPSVTVPAPTA